MRSSEVGASSTGAAAGAASGAAACCGAAAFCCWWRLTPPATTLAVPAITAVLPTVRSTGRRRIMGMVVLLLSSVCWLSALQRLCELAERRLDQVGRDPGAVDEHPARAPNRFDQRDRPEVLPEDDQGGIA